MYTEHVPQLVIVSIEINRNNHGVYICTYNDGVYICTYLCMNMYIYISRKSLAARQRISFYVFIDTRI